jgi:Cof subfamily protein (haloacid dehalogenase superfamily)
VIQVADDPPMVVPQTPTLPAGRGKVPGGAPEIALVISDVDGTLVTPEKVLTPAAVAAVRRLDAAGVGFTLISSRPPRGMAGLVAELDIRLAFGGFNGGSLAMPDQTLIETHPLAADVARRMLALLAARGVGAWVFADGDWRLKDPNGPNVPLERLTVGFDPTVVAGFDDVIGRIDKIVGVSDDLALLARVEAEAQALIGAKASILRSQPYYLDVTSPRSNKGDGVSALCQRLGVDLARTAVIGDMFNDVAMFAKTGFSIAMGQAPEAVAARADAVALSNTEDGFADAVNRLILPRAARGASAGRR